MVRREIEIEAGPDEVWEAIATEAGRETWLEEAERDVLVESEEPPRRLVWWWEAEPATLTRVEIELVPAVSGTRVIVTESVPAAVPLTALAMSLTLVAA